MVKSDFEQVEIFIEDSCSEAEIQQIMENLHEQKDVEKVEFRSKEDALKIMKQRWGESGYLLDSLDKNPLPSSVIVTVKSLEKADKVTEYAQEIAGVEDVKY